METDISKCQWEWLKDGLFVDPQTGEIHDEILSDFFFKSCEFKTENKSMLRGTY